MSDKRETLKCEILNEMSHFKYHWFWGLQYYENAPENNLAKDITPLLNDQQLIDSLREKQFKLYGKTFLVRLFYRLFNIDNFMHDTCKLVAYNTYYLSQNEMGKSRYPEWGAYFCGLDLFNWDFGVGKIIDDKIEDNIRPMRHRIEEEERNELFKQFFENTYAKINSSLTITHTMLPGLKILGINKQVGEELSQDEIRSQYKKQSLKKHPDRNSNSQKSHKDFTLLGNTVFYFQNRISNPYENAREPWKNEFSAF